MNSRYLIPIRRLPYLTLDNVTDEDLENFDITVLYGYDYKNYRKAWDKIERYIKNGGKVFIETGNDVKETNTATLSAKTILPPFFPIENTTRGELGSLWNIDTYDKQLFSDVDINKLAAPQLDGKPWVFSYPTSDAAVRSGAKVLFQHSGKPLIVEWNWGKGKVIWSGMNLFYHAIANKNLNEGMLVKNLLNSFVQLTPVTYGDSQVNWEGAETIHVKGKEDRGVLVRQQNYPGWNVVFAGGLKPLVYSAGPAYPGFIYFKVPQDKLSNYSVKVNQGYDQKNLPPIIVVFLVVIFVLDKVITDGKILFSPTIKKLKLVSVHVRGWWVKEDEE